MAQLQLTLFALFVFLTAGQSREFIIHRETSQINVAVGDNTLLSLGPLVNVSSATWYFGEQVIGTWIKNRQACTNENVSHVLVFLNGSLLLNSVEVSDRGEYRVVMNLNDGSQKNMNITLEVSGPTSRLQMDNQRKLGNYEDLMNTGPRKGDLSDWKFSCGDVPVTKSERVLEGIYCMVSSSSPSKRGVSYGKEFAIAIVAVWRLWLD